MFVLPYFERCENCNQGMREARELLAQSGTLLQALRFPWLEAFVVRKLLWVLSEGPRGPSIRHKYYEVPFRSLAAQNSSHGAKGLRAEHVVPLKDAVARLLAEPDKALDIADEIVICIVTREEALRLDRANGMGWERYESAGVPVIDVRKASDDPARWVVSVPDDG